MPPVEAVILAALVHMVVGAIWYSPRAYGLRWQLLARRHSRELQQTVRIAYYASFVAALITSYVMAKLMELLEANTIWSGMSTGLWLWVGFVVTSFVPAYIYAKRPLMLLFIDCGYILFSLMAMGFVMSLFI